MSLREYYGLVFERAGKVADQRARRFGFWVAPVVGVFLLLVWYFVPHLGPRFARIVPYAGIATLLYFLLNLLWLLLIRTPYDLYRELLAKLPDHNRAAISDGLSQLLIEGQQVFKDAEYNGVNNFVGEIISWKHSSEAFLSDMGSSYIARFKNAVPFDERMIYSGEQHIEIINDLRKGCDLLTRLVDEYSRRD